MCFRHIKSSASTKRLSKTWFCHLSCVAETLFDLDVEAPNDLVNSYNMRDSALRLPVPKGALSPLSSFPSNERIDYCQGQSHSPHIPSAILQNIARCISPMTRFPCSLYPTELSKKVNSLKEEVLQDWVFLAYHLKITKHFKTSFWPVLFNSFFFPNLIFFANTKASVNVFLIKL